MKNKNIVYYKGELKEKKQLSLEKKLNKLTHSEQTLTNKLDHLLENKDLSKQRIQKKIVSYSSKITATQVKIKRVNENLALLEKEELEKESLYTIFKKWFKNIKYENQIKIWGFIFVIPWIIGMLLFFIPSLTQTLYWSFHEVTIKAGTTTTKFVGIRNFIFLFADYVIDNSTIFSVSLISFIQELLIDLPVIIIFSVLIAVLLNKDFKGHRLIKAIFFIPVIYNLAVITETLTGNFGSHISNTMGSDVRFVTQITGFFREIGIGESLMTIVLNAIERIFTIVNLSGIQILIFIAAIQSIPKHLYEAAEIEGATKYETFWKITIPMITPMILTASVFTIVESFTRAPIFRFLDYSVADGNYGLASAISISYFIINLAIIGFIFLLFKGRVFYYDDEK